MSIPYLKLLSFLILFSACRSETPNKQTGLVEADFSVDKSEVSTVPYENIRANFKILTPKSWNPFDKEFEKLIASNLLINDLEDAKLEKGYLNAIDTSMLLILNVENVEPSNYKTLRKNYLSIMNRDQLWKDIQFSEFKHNCFRFEQYVLQNESLINFRVIGYEGSKEQESPTFELMYLLNRKNINSTIHSVESSIGSLDCIN